ncbi:PREDICTED: uncharacterized protein LOC106815379 [Priapulus caudatus]|uniref:Uncharacterized protein LOC106815379 n=1 Tax=Priapulus caudatus TaxID=37621 RepID=A0ABM1ESZ9_PRICU|nr:PREDICTED: uncharacterized protein LOC106815379 [Priapulus caudatus]
MHLGGNNEQFEYLMTDEAGTRRVLDEITEEKDLGIWINSDLKPTLQCTRAANKAMGVLRSIKKTFKYIDKRCFLILYKTFIRPHLEYCVQAWSPYYKKDMDLLEKVQRRATKLVHSIRNLEYERRLEILGLYSLEQRRERGDLIETYKILTDKENINSNQFFTLATGTTRGNPLKLFKNRSRLQLRQHFFSQRVVNAWNALPTFVVEAKTVNCFKNKLDLHWTDMGTGT